jgi:hypothetical protein
LQKCFQLAFLLHQAAGVLAQRSELLLGFAQLLKEGSALLAAKSATEPATQRRGSTPCRRQPLRCAAC